MSEPEYSNISLNINRAATADNGLPMWQGEATVLDLDNAGKTVPVKFSVAAWGPNVPQAGGREYYNLRITAKDPDSFARMVAAQRAAKRRAEDEPDGGAPQPVRNQPRGFELKQVGTGIIFERTANELAANPKMAKFWGYALVQLPSGRSYLDVSLWHRPAGTANGKAYTAFYSGSLKPHDPNRPAPDPRPAAEPA